LEDYVAGPFADTKMKQQTRAALLAGTMMSVIAAAPASMAAERQATSAFAPAPMVLAQAVVNPIDQQQQKGKGPPPKGQPPAAIQRTAPPPVQPKGVQAQPKVQQPVQTQPVPPTGQQPVQTQQPPQTAPAMRQVSPPVMQPGGPVQSQQPQQPFGGPGIARPGPGVAPPPHGAALSPMRGNVDQIRTHRIERRENDGRVVIQEPGGRTIVRDGGRVFIRHDDNERFRHFGGNHRFEDRGRERFTYISRPGGYQIITVTDHNGRMLRRVRRGPDGREVVLINNAVVGAAVATGFILALAAPQILIPRERYIVDVQAAPPPLLYETLNAPPVVPLERAYALDEIRYNVNLRDRVRRLDLTTVTFDSGSWELGPEQYPRLEAVANVIRQVLANNPEAVFMIEGHTDAVGADVDNLSLSDRRAESVAVVLTEQFQIPPENLVTQGYGEQFLKVPVEGPQRENRRVAVRNISRLLAGK
jgi:outer membrane protein OmpA-like peptidoglycan-associated protein